MANTYRTVLDADNSGEYTPHTRPLALRGDIITRESLWIIPVLFAAIVSYANADFAFWTDANGARVAPAMPTPEPATGGLMLLGFGMLMLMRNAQRSRRAT